MGLLLIFRFCHSSLPLSADTAMTCILVWPCTMSAWGVATAMQALRKPGVDTSPRPGASMRRSVSASAFVQRTFPVLASRPTADRSNSKVVIAR